MMIAMLLVLLSWQNEPIKVASKAFTESVILGEIARLSIKQAGFETEHVRQLGGSQVVWKALLQGEIQAYPEYTGTLYRELLHGQNINDLVSLKNHLEELGIGMTLPLGFNNTYALGMKKEGAQRMGVRSITDLKDEETIRFGFSNEFLDRGDGWPGLRAAYGLSGKNVMGLQHDLAYRGLDEDAIDVMDLYSTDAEIAYYDLEVLEDPKNYFPDYQAVFLYRKELEQSRPGFAQALHRLAGRIDNQRMIALNADVKLNGKSDTQVAATFLEGEFGKVIRVEQSHLAEQIGQRTAEHLYLVSISLLAALLISIPLGILAYKVEWLEQAVLTITGIIQTIPSLALLVVMIPLFGIGYLPAMVALFLYSLLPIVRNTHSGLKAIDNEMLESAHALGLPASLILRKVELPLALPAILAGIKTSAVINVGTATLGALIGAGGYGQPILTGIRLDDTGLILQGAIPAAVLAFLVQGIFELSERAWIKQHS